MLMALPLFRSVLHTVRACGLGLIVATAVSTVSSVTTMPAVAAMAEHMHRDHSGEEQHPNPVC